MYGIGRSSGNVPTEVMAAVFQRLGIETGIDPLDIIDLAESYLRPLAEHLHSHDMTAVSLGLGAFTRASCRRRCAPRRSTRSAPSASSPSSGRAIPCA